MPFSPPAAPPRHRRSRLFGAALLALAAAAGASAQTAAQAAPAAAPAASAAAAPGRTPPLRNSTLDAPLFYQLLIGELQYREGQPGAAYQVILDAARRSLDETLFRRAVEIALQARAGEEALAAARAWRASMPTSLDALRTELQILSALNRLDAAADPLRALLLLTPVDERSALIAAVPRFLQRAADQTRGAQLVEEVLTPYLEQPTTRVAAQASIGRAWLAAGDADRALALARAAHATDASSPGPVLLAMDLMARKPEAEALITDYLARPDTEPAMRLVYVRALTGAQRYGEALQQLERVTQQRPDFAPPYLTLGALHLELKQPAAGEAALKRYLELTEGAQPPAPPAAAGTSPAGDDADADDDSAAPPEQGRIQAWMMLAQAAEQRRDFAAAEGWLAKIDDPQRALEVLARRATILARQGRVDQARALLRQAPEREPGDARAKTEAEVSMLRELQRWSEAHEVMAAALQREPDDTGLLYEQSMIAEKLGRLDEMERLLRRVIELKPDNAHAYNALGYSLADRGLRLPEARSLIARALELSPNDPFITDSLGWVEFRLGNRAEALRLLQRAYASRPDPEIAAHLGEVLWAEGREDEARRVWRDANQRDAGNEVLRETLARLKVRL